MIYEIDGDLRAGIFNVSKQSFDPLALEIFYFQQERNKIYNQYCNSIHVKGSSVEKVTNIPFLPVSFFRTYDVISFERTIPAKVFTSSGTTGMTSSRHLVKDIMLYEQSFITGFQLFYNNPSEYAILCLLPSYLEREGSSLIYMATRLVELSGNEDSGFFLHAEGKLVEILKRREKEGKRTILLGVTYALLDFAMQMSLPLKYTIVMETGGMKGRRQELTRAEVHQQLKKAFEIEAVHSEYGMTELLSQAYAKKDGIFEPPPWMKVFVRSQDDPFEISHEGVGLLCIIDLANIYSCSFIETADVGRLYTDGRFEVLGRLDNSDIRGCSLLTL